MQDFIPGEFVDVIIQRKWMRYDFKAFRKRAVALAVDELIRFAVR